MRKTKAFIVSFILFFYNLVAFAAHDFKVDGIYYNIVSSIDLTVEVTCKNGVSGYATNTNDYSGNVIIPKQVTYKDKEYSVTSIGTGAFHWCSMLASVTIPNSVTNIESTAFENCN